MLVKANYQDQCENRVYCSDKMDKNTVFQITGMKRNYVLVIKKIVMYKCS